MTQLACDVCRATIGADDLFPELGIARCPKCRAVMDLKGRGGHGAAKPTHERPPAPLPERFHVRDDDGGFAVTWRWFSAKYVALAFFCVAWDAFLVFWYSIALGGKNVPWIMIVFPIGHLAVGVGLTYSTLAGFVNRTRIAVEGNRLLVQHGPLPWPGQRDLPVDDLKQLFTAEVMTTGKNRSVSYSYSVSAIRTSGTKALVLVKGLDDMGQALYLEQAFEKRLGIVDVPVAGEAPRIG